MSTILIPEKVRVLNSPTQANVVFRNNAGATALPGVATQLFVDSIGLTKASHVKRVSLTRGLTFKQNTWSVAFTVTSTPTFNTPLYLEVVVETPNREFRSARPEYEFRSTFRYKILSDGTLNAAEASSQFAASVNSNAYRNREFLVVGDGVTTPGTLVLSVQAPQGYSEGYRGAFIRSIRLVNEQGSPFNPGQVSIVATETVKANRGINYGADLEFKYKLQRGNSGEYFFDREEIPYEKQYYTVAAWDIKVDRPDPKAHDVSEYVRVVLILNEATMESVIDNIGTFFLTTPATKFTALEPTGLVVAANDAVALTNTTAASSATNLDLDHGVLTPIFGTLAAVAPKYVMAESVAIDNTLSDFMLPLFTTNA